MKETRSFFELVTIAYKEISDAIDNNNFPISDFMSEINWSEICDWCKFTDIGHSRSIYERAINTAIFMVLIDQNVSCTKIQPFIKNYIYNCWDTEPIDEMFESYESQTGDEQILVYNDRQISIPIEFYKFIKEGKL